MVPGNNLGFTGSMQTERQIRWKLGVWAAIAVVAITMIPQITLWVKRGNDWQGAYAYTDTDELAYSAYLNSLIHGRPRRNNPEVPDFPSKESPKSENIFSIQFIPAYSIAFVARIFGLSASTAFIWLTPFVAFFSSLTIFWLLVDVTRDDKTAAIGVLIILLCGVVVSQNPIRQTDAYGVFSFLRRYIPGFPFPFFFLFCICAFRAFTQKGEKAFAWWSLGVGLSFGVLVYSYWYLWTAAAAWLLCFTLIWLLTRPTERKLVFKCTGISTVVMIALLIPYVRLLTLRSPAKDNDLALVLTHAPDLFRFTELLGALILLALAWGVKRRKIALGDPAVVFVASCAIVPFGVFNQQIVTGRSLQPFHYEQFILNYLILLGVVITDHLLWKLIHRRPLFSAVLALVVGSTLAAKTSAVNMQANGVRDEAIPLFKKLDAEARYNRSSGAVLFDRTLLAASSQTTCYSLPILWSPFTYIFGTMSSENEQERLFQYFYYLGIDGRSIEQRLTSESLFRGAMFGLPRVNKALTQNFEPISEEEIRSKVEAYSAYSRSFSREHANQWPLSYLILSKARSYDLSNLDRWYVRDSGEVMGDSIVYRVRLRSEFVNESQSKQYGFGQ